jgi:integrase
MGRTIKKRKRTRVGDGIYRDGYGLSAKVQVGTGAEALSRSKRFPFDTLIGDIRDWQATTRDDLRKAAKTPKVVKGTLEAEAPRYLALVRHLPSYKSEVSNMKAWTALYGRLKPAQITEQQIRGARAQWAVDEYAVKTVNNRIQTLRNLYRVLYGDKMTDPTAKVEALTPPPSVKVMVAAKVFRTVAANLTSDPKTRARFMVISSTGVRPSELKRAEPADVDLARRVWQVRTGKGGEPRGLWLNDEMLAALQAFVDAEAWGHFDASDYAKALYAAGWPKNVRPYQARHSVALELGERQVGLGDVSNWLGHRDPATTRRFYMGVLASRQKASSEALAGRFEGWKAPEPEAAPDLETMETEGTVQ